MQALTPLTLGISSVKASLLGAWWGFGHCIGQLILGILMLLLKASSQHDYKTLDRRYIRDFILALAACIGWRQKIPWTIQSLHDIS